MNKQDKANLRIVLATEAPFTEVRRICATILLDGKPEETKLRAASIIFRLATFLQEIAITTQDGDVEKGMKMASDAINRSNAAALRTVDFLKGISE